MINKLKGLKTYIKYTDNVEETTIKNDVINYIIDFYETDEDIKCFFEDLLSGGCQSGFINHLISYKDTIAFFDKYEDEIENLISNNMEMMGFKTRPLFIDSLNGTAESITQEKNLLSWFAFEEVARCLQSELYEEITI
jgi:hypothetical protein